MSEATRRTFLVAAGAGAAALGVAAVAPSSAAAATTKGSHQPAELPTGEPLVAYVSDASTGELTLLVGEREVLITDPDLVSRLTSAASE
jgi:hypothetical protein